MKTMSETTRQKVKPSKKFQPICVNLSTEIAFTSSEGLVRLSMSEALRIASCSTAGRAAGSKDEDTTISKDTVAV